MFQNINNEGVIDTKEYKKGNEKKNKLEIFSNILSIKNIPIYIVTLMISMVGIGGDISPFGISILGACLANSIPALGIVIVAIIGNAIKFGISGALRIFINSINNDSIYVFI